MVCMTAAFISAHADSDDATLAAWNLGRQRAQEVYRQYPTDLVTRGCADVEW